MIIQTAAAALSREPQVGALARFVLCARLPYERARVSLAGGGEKKNPRTPASGARNPK